MPSSPRAFRRPLAAARRRSLLRALLGAGLLPVTLAAQQAPVDTLRRVPLPALETVASPVGRGRPQAAGAVSARILREAPAGASPLRALGRVAGVNVQTSDPFGQYEWANRITLRGFQSQQIGQTLDGITLGDMSYGNYNGLGVVRAVDPDLVESATVLQGSATLATAVGNSLGGVVEYRSAEPSNRAGVTLRQMVGSANARRSAVLLESGLRNMGAGVAFKGALSVSRFDADKWKGTGERFSPFPYEGQLLFGEGGLFGSQLNWRDQATAKGVLYAGAQRVMLFWNYADGKEHGYADLSLDRWRTVGREWDQYATWNEAVAGAQSATPDIAYFHGSQGARRNHLAYLRGDLAFGRVGVELTPYLHVDRGAGDWFAPSYGSALYPDPIMFRQTQYASERAGAIARMRIPVGPGTIETGAWLETNTADQRRPRFRLQDWTVGPAIDFGTVLRLDFDRTARLTSTLFYAKHDLPLADGRVRLTYGAKWLRLGARFTNNGSTLTEGVAAGSFGDEGRPDLDVPTSIGVLPQAGAVIRLREGMEAFANVAANASAFPYNPATGIYGTSPAGFASFVASARPERTLAAESGVRWQGARGNASLAVYRIGYRNRLIPLTVCPPTATCNASFANVGGITSLGAELSGELRVIRGITAWGAGAWSRATYDDDYIGNQQTGDVVPAAGKDVVDAPRLQLAGGVRVERGAFFVELQGRRLSSRALSIVNDVRVPGYTVTDATVGAALGQVGSLRDLRVRLSAQNLLDADYLATIGTNGFSTRGGSANSTVNPGVPRQLFLSLDLVP